MIQHSKTKLILLLIMTFGLISVSHGAGIENIYFKDTVEVDGTRLRIQGTGLFRYLSIIKAYVGALYLEDGQTAQDVFSDIAKRLEVEYFYAIKGEDFGPVTYKMIAQNVADETLMKLRPRIDAHVALYQDVQPNDRYALTYIPGKGTELSLNGDPLGVVEGADFASAMFSIWLGTKPLNRSFKHQLLGLK